MSENNNYCGIAHSEDVTLKSAAPMPANYLNASKAPDGIFPLVRYKGRFGFLCGEYQEFERRNITYKEAKEIAWSFFGTCGHVTSFLDEHGNLIDEEKEGIF